MKMTTDGPDVVQFHCAGDRLSSVKFGGAIAIPRDGRVFLLRSRGAWDRVCLCKMTPWHLRPCASCRGRALRALEMNLKIRKMLEVQRPQARLKPKQRPLHGKQIFTKISDRAGISKKKVASVMDALKAVAVEQLKEKGKFEIKGLATFTVWPQPPRPAREKMVFGKKVMVKAKQETKRICVRAASGRAFYGLHVWGEWDLRAVAAAKAEDSDDDQLDSDDQQALKDQAEGTEIVSGMVSDYGSDESDSESDESTTL